MCFFRQSRTRYLWRSRAQAYSETIVETRELEMAERREEVEAELDAKRAEVEERNLEAQLALAEADKLKEEVSGLLRVRHCVDCPPVFDFVPTGSSITPLPMAPCSPPPS